MGEIKLNVVPSGVVSNNTLTEYSKEIQHSRFEYIIKKISDLDIFHSENKTNIVFGMGKHPKSSYTKLKKSSGIELIWCDSIFPTLLKPLSYLIASYEGLVKINDGKRLFDVFKDLSRLSMVGFYHFDRQFESSFVDTIKRNKYCVYADTVVKEDPGYFIYQVDTDNGESSTGIYEIVSYGVKCSSELKGILSLSS